MAQVSAYVTAAHIKFLLLHDGRSEDAIRGFFREIYDSYLRVHLSSWAAIPTPLCCATARRHDRPRCSWQVHCVPRLTTALQRTQLLAQVIMNPFFTPTTRISSDAFHSKVRATAKSFFR